MLRSRDISAGKYYVNRARKIAREVVESDDKTVTFNTYHLDTGNSCSSPSQCTRRAFAHWADHEATPAELEGLNDRLLEALLYSPRMPVPEEAQEISIDEPAKPLVGTSIYLYQPI